MVIVAVCLIEAAFRFASGYTPINGLMLTLAARLTQMAFILVFAFRHCGIQTASLKNELVVGVAISAAFGAVVMGVHLISRLFMDKGLLGVLISAQSTDKWFLFLIVGCIIGPFVEELFFRGLVYSWMRTSLAPGFCIILSSLLFASMHGRISVVQLTGGLLFASLYEWRKNIWAPFAVHVCANIGIWIVPYYY